MKAQRLLLLIPSMTGAGGTERMVESLSILLSDSQRKVFQASFDAPGVHKHFESQTILYALGPIPRLPLFLRPITYLLSAWRLRRLKRQLNIDLTISNLWGADLISILSGGTDRKIALCHINVVGNPSNHLMVRLRPMVAAIYRRFDRVLAVSETLAAELKALYRLSSERIGHIHNFVDRPDATSKLPDDGVQRFVWCGRFNPEKNVEGLLYAWAGFVCDRRGMQLVLMGDGPLHDELIALAGSLKLHIEQTIEDPHAQVVFLGKVPEPAAYMLGARALLLSSHAEGLPMVVLEALSLGLPVLASDCRAGGVRTALLGRGECNPSRTDIEFTPAGVLLPVPSREVAASLRLWGEALAAASHDTSQLSCWQVGALERASNFSSQAVRNRWLQAIDFTSCP